MKALILCAGFGSRLGDLCTQRPKPLLSLGDETILEHILRHVAAADIRDVFINLHHLAEQFPAALGDGSRFGLRLHYVHESAPLGTAGTPRTLASLLEGHDLLVHYGDIVTNHDLRGLSRQHEVHAASATVLLHQRAHANSFAFFGEDGRHLDRFVERPSEPPEDPRPSWVFSGVCVLSASLVHALPVAPVVDLPRDVFPNLATRGELVGERLDGYRWAIDSPERLAMARHHLSGTTDKGPHKKAI